MVKANPLRRCVEIKIDVEIVCTIRLADDINVTMVAESEDDVKRVQLTK